MNINQLDLNLLIALNALLSERSVTRAAQRVGVTQSTMSGSLARLRRFFDDPLLIRMGREYRLTEVGEELEQSVREVIFLIESRIARRPVFDPAVDKHTFSIAATDYAMVVLGHPLLERLSTKAPGVRLHFHQHPGSSAAYEQMKRGLVDIVIAPAPDTSVFFASFPSEVLLSERWVCAVSPDHPEVGDELSEEQYFALPHLVWAADASSSTSIAEGDRQIASLGRERDVGFRCESFLALPFLLPGTRLITLIQERLGRRLVEAAAVKLLEPPVPLASFNLRMVWHPSRSSDSALLWLRSTMLEVGASI